MADTSDGGWETIKQYQAHPLASDSEDEKKYRRQSIELPRKNVKMTLKMRVKSISKHLIQGLLILCLAAYFQHGVRERAVSDQSVSHELVNRSSPFANSRDSLEQGDAVTPVEASSIGAESVRSSNQPVLMVGSSNGEGAGEADDEILKDEYFFTDNFYEYEQGQAENIVKDRLRKHTDFWREIGTDPVTLDIFENGYVIPFYSKPESMFCKITNLL